MGLEFLSQVRITCSNDSKLPLGDTPVILEIPSELRRRANSQYTPICLILIMYIAFKQVPGAHMLIFLKSVICNLQIVHNLKNKVSMLYTLKS